MPEYGRGRQPEQRNMYVVGAYKDELLTELRKDPDFQLALLGSSLPDKITPNQIKESFKDCVFDYAFVPGTTTDERIFVCMEVTCPYADAVTWKDLYIHIYVFTPKMSVQWDMARDGEKNTYYGLVSEGYIGNKIDMVVDIIDRKINGFKNLALGSIRLAPREGMQIFSYVDGYYGKQLTYTATDFNLLPPSALQYTHSDGEPNG